MDTFIERVSSLWHQKIENREVPNHSKLINELPQDIIDTSLSIYPHAPNIFRIRRAGQKLAQTLAIPYQNISPTILFKDDLITRKRVFNILNHTRYDPASYKITFETNDGAHEFRGATFPTLHEGDLRGRIFMVFEDLPEKINGRISIKSMSVTRFNNLRCAVVKENAFNEAGQKLYEGAELKDIIAAAYQHRCNAILQEVANKILMS